MRRVLFWAHLGTGVAISALVLFFAITGSLIAYQRQVVNVVDHRSWQPGAAPQGATRIPLNALIASVATSASGPVEMVTIHPDPADLVEIQTADRKVYFAAPYTGKVQGPMSPRLRAFFAEVTALHRWFGLSNAHHATATAVKGAVNLLFLFLICSGAVLWFPKRWTSAAFQSGIVPRFDISGRARNYNWHQVTGLWIGLPLSVIVITGIVMAYPLANALLFRMAGSPPPPARVNRPLNAQPNGSGGHGHGGGNEQTIPTNLDQAFAQATRVVPDWKSASLRLTPGIGPLNISVDRGDGGRPDKRDQVSIDPTTLQIVRKEPFADQSRGQRWRAWVRFMHTGEAGGWWGETLAVLAALGAIVLSITGITLSLNRFQRWRTG